MKNHWMVSVTALGLAVNAFARGPEWVEQDDAGSLPSSAQVITGGGTLTKISGSLMGFNQIAGDGDFEDMYLLCVTVPSEFCILTSQGSGGSADFDTQLWVFNFNGGGIMGSDNFSESDNGSAIFQFANDGTKAGIYEPGLYYICISGAGNRPTSFENQIFNFVSPTEISGPDGQGGQGSVNGWAAEGATGEYLIAVNGVCPVPEPGALALLAAGALMASRRRRRA